MKVEWTSDLETGIERVDEQHKVLVDILNRLNDINSTDNEEMEDIFDELYDYATYHFMNEECLMLKNDYVGAKEHCKFHNDFKFQIQKYRELFKKNNITFSKSTQKYLLEWFISHIRGTDIQMASALKRKNEV